MITENDIAEMEFSNEVPRPLRPILSIVSPNYKYDPTRLLDKIIIETASFKDIESVEFVLIDDGSGNEELNAKITAKINEFKIAARYLVLTKNQGRSFARNRLIDYSNGQYILFLDSDMLPDSANFIAMWLDLINKTDPTIAYGGFTMIQASTDKKYALARALAGRSDCLNATERSLRGPIAVATSNLLVRRDVMQAIPFDCGFVGWGWEDVDWALRANEKNYAVAHVEIPATHLGLDVDEVILEKFAKAGPNFKHITTRHPDMHFLASTRTAMLASKLPFIKLAVKPIHFLATTKLLPLKIRALSARIYRAIWAAISLQIK